MEQKLIELDGKHNYVLDIETYYNGVVERFNLKTKDYFDALRELRDRYRKEHNAIGTKANQIVYGNPEGKTDRKHRDRSDLYLKVVQRSEKYKTWNNFFTAIGVVAAIILIFQVTALISDASVIFVNEKFDMVCHIILVTACWSGLVFNSAIGLKSFKYMPISLPKTKAERKWLKKYFSNIKDIINARCYLEVLIQREEYVEKCIELADRVETCQKVIDANSELIKKRSKYFDSAMKTKREAIYQMKKDVEKVMDDFMYDADVNTALEHVLENWKDY